MEDIRTNEQRIKDLKKEGLSIRQIAERLKISKSNVGRVLNEGVPSVPRKADIVPDIVPFVPKCPNTAEQTGEQSESVADLKQRINPILRDIYKRINDIKTKQENLKREMSEEFNERVGKVLKYSLNNALEGLKIQIIAEIREGSNETSKAQD